MRIAAHIGANETERNDWVENPGPLPIMATNAANIRAAKDVPAPICCCLCITTLIVASNAAAAQQYRPGTKW